MKRNKLQIILLSSVFLLNSLGVSALASSPSTWENEQYNESEKQNGNIDQQEPENSHETQNSKITKQPTFDNPTIEVIDESKVKQYEWASATKTNNLTYYSSVEFPRDNNGNLIDKKDYFKYDKDTNTYSSKYNGLFHMNGMIKINKNSKITFTGVKGSFGPSQPLMRIQQSDFVLRLYNIINSVEPVEIEYDNSKVNCEKSKNDAGTQICTQVITLDNLDEGYYMMNLESYNISDNESEEYANKFKFENIDTYNIEKLKNETGKTLSKIEANKIYIGNVIYNDGTSEITNVIEKTKTAEKQNTNIEEKITDVVSNPLTGDNIIYTIAICLISMSSLVILSVKLKKNM